MNKTIVVGVDGTSGSQRAVRWGAEESANRRAPLLIHAVGAPDAFRGDVTPPQEWSEPGQFFVVCRAHRLLPAETVRTVARRARH
ncbi:MAG TPA: universal stress protein [Amycolatopsis sp.]|nr:universal stress protein [Amycolatopsis sp.]